ncbi:hypothetical protein CK556_03250 [Mesoplasma chauliocola]|uniref:Uncharacterized protein n=1 Tax=Mesoplasma chauliocola TaxID=216427 RepID=A0A249SNZ5_9MOLU|nr:DnaD domain protein [Mesoplasma chauliocola]ASZ09346.1 hypothetical protein CK556_03250 [Mesoplasma chauliocola]
MNILNRKYLIYWNKELAKEDHEVLFNLYQPIIGASAIGLYNTLIMESNWSKKLNSSPFTLERIALMTSSSEKQLKKNLGKLTKLKLIRCLKSKKSGNMVIVISSPLSPSQFFQNETIKNWLLRKIGEENFELANIQFKNKEFKINDLDYEIEDLFENNDDNDFDFVDLDSIVETARKEIYLCDQNLNLDDLQRMLYKSGVMIEINESVKSNLDALLMQKEFNEEFIFELMKENYRKSLNEINWISLSKDFKAILKEQTLNKANIELSESDLNIINSFNSTEWTSFYFQCMGIEADDKISEIINSLKVKYNLSDGILNCLISYSYLKNNKRFIYNYVVKIIESIKEKQITTTKELYTYLKKASKKQVKGFENNVERTKSIFKEQKNEFIMEANINIEW